MLFRMAYDVPLRLLSKVKISVEIKGLCECHNCLFFDCRCDPRYGPHDLTLAKVIIFFLAANILLIFLDADWKFIALRPKTAIVKPHILPNENLFPSINFHKFAISK